MCRIGGRLWSGVARRCSWCCWLLLPSGARSWEDFLFLISRCIFRHLRVASLYSTFSLRAIISKGILLCASKLEDDKRWKEWWVRTKTQDTKTDHEVSPASDLRWPFLSNVLGNISEGFLVSFGYHLLAFLLEEQVVGTQRPTRLFHHLNDCWCHGYWILWKDKGRIGACKFGQRKIVASSNSKFSTSSQEVNSRSLSFCIIFRLICPIQE